MKFRSSLVGSLPLLFSAPFFLGFLGGCGKLITYAIDRELGDDASVTSLASSGSGKNACDLITDAEIEAASGKKILKKETGNPDTCSWALSGDTPQNGGNIALQIVPEFTMKVIPILGEQKDIPGLGNKAEWSGGMAPNLRVHVNGGKVLNFLLVDPQQMMKDPGITEKALPGATTKKLPNGSTVTTGTTAVNMEYPVLEKEAIALGKAAVSRY